MTARLALIVLGVGLACGGDPPRQGDGPGPGVGEPAPAFGAVTLAGDSVALSDLAGEVVLVNVWATWCAPCRKEIPALQALWEQKAPEGLRVVGVTVDSRAAEEQVRGFIDEFGMTYDIWWDPDQSAVAAFGAIGVPLTVLIDRDGRIAWRHLGVLEHEDPVLLSAVNTALSGDGQPGQ